MHSLIFISNLVHLWCLKFNFVSQRGEKVHLVSHFLQFKFFLLKGMMWFYFIYSGLANDYVTILTGHLDLTFTFSFSPAKRMLSSLFIVLTLDYFNFILLLF